MAEKKGIRQLYTKEGRKLAEEEAGMPWEIYPRPQLRRREWMCLNGMWDFSVKSGEWESIRVPFCPESLLSGFEGEISCGDLLHYRRTFELPEGWSGRKILLHFGAVSRWCRVLLNGKSLCEHDMAYLPFTVEITEELSEKENVLELEVRNELSTRYPYGKQKKKRGGMWYTPVSGIWQSVWLEPVPDTYIENIRIVPDMRGAEIQVFGKDLAEGSISCMGQTMKLTAGSVRLEPEEIHLWSPEDPFLYEIEIACGEDKVQSYFALRSLEIKTFDGIARLCLNGKPYFFHGLLDQGYFSDGIYTPAVPQLYEQDILKMKELGFNTLRKHIKIEPEIFYYDCDRLGMVVFQDMVNNGAYHFLRDTIFPTLGYQKVDDEIRRGHQKTHMAFLKAMEATVKQLFNHPCICYWTIFNEGWGQFQADRVYTKLKNLDAGRFVDATSGWFHQKKSDVDSLHIYFESLHLGKKRELPQVLSEFGGYVYKIPEHSFRIGKTYGYKIFMSRESLVKDLRRIYLEEMIPLARQGLCASIYTQVSDVEDETNGILTYDREVCRVKPEEMADLALLLQEAVENGEKPERAEKPEKPEKAEKEEKPENVEEAEEDEKTENPAKTERVEKTENPKKKEEPEKP